MPFLICVGVIIDWFPGFGAWCKFPGEATCSLKGTKKPELDCLVAFL